MKFKIGDQLYCYNPVIMSSDKRKTTTKNKYYNIILIEENNFAINDDNNDMHFFSFHDHSESDYTKWFIDKLTYQRKLKLQKLNELTR